MVAAANNPYPSILTVEGTTPSTPAAGQQRLFVRSSDHVLCYVNSSGTVSQVGGGLTNPLTTTGDTIYSSSGTTAARLGIGSSGNVLTVAAGVPSWAAPAGGGTAYGQALAYPTTFTGDNDNFASFSNWADVSAFDVAEILNSTVGHLVTKGASKDQKKRFTLGTTKAAAYDFQWWGVLPDLTFWSTAGDAYVDLALKTSADGHIAGFRLLPQVLATQWYNILVQPVVSGSVITTTAHPLVNRGLAVNLRITRDGSNNHAFYIGTGQAPVAFARYLNASDDAPYTPTPSGTIARSEILIHTPSGPGSTAEFGMYIDAFVSA
jgi:hypothetical protein